MREKQGYMTGLGGLKLFYRTWEPERPVGSLVLVHGTNEHIGRYEHVAAYFVQRNMAVLALDQRGYGRSAGVRCHVDRFADYLADLHSFVSQAQAYGTPIMVGHSLGGLIAYRYAVTYPESLSAVILSSPFFALRLRVNPVQKALVPVLSALAPRLQIASNIPPENVSRNPDVVRAYGSDPLVGNTATPRWFAECQKAGQASLTGEGGELLLPALFLQAGDDRLVSPEATRAVFQRVPHDRKTFKLYPGRYHELFNDPGNEEVFADMWQWMLQQDLVHTL